ncbi:ankyrin repeat domain-containing protein [Lacisediminihabitans sp. FW035]
MSRNDYDLSRFSRPMDAESDDDEPTDRFLRLACLSYTEPEMAAMALAMLAEDPLLASASPYALAACGRAEALATWLTDDPAAATREGGPHRWPPLLYLCYSRLALGDAVATMSVLLEAGADPNSGFLWKGLTSPFTALTGVLGGGERGESMHPQGVALAGLLLNADADPNDNQALYNRMFLPDDEHLDPLLSSGAGRPHASPWRELLGAAYPSPEEMMGEHLRSAAEKGFTARVRRLLEHGVDPNTVGYHPILGDATAYEIAVRNGHPEAAELLARAGGHSDRIELVDVVLSAVLSGGPVPDEVTDLPSARPDAMRLAAEQHGIDALERLLARGYDVSTPGQYGTTALHEAAARGDTSMARWLVAHGADLGAEDDRFGSTPSGWASHLGHPELSAELSPGASQ